MALNHSGAEGDALSACADGVGSVFYVCADDDLGLGRGRLVQEEGRANAEKRVGTCATL
jgi:hypothetical protein